MNDTLESAYICVDDFARATPLDVPTRKQIVTSFNALSIEFHRQKKQAEKQAQEQGEKAKQASDAEEGRIAKELEMQREQEREVARQLEELNAQRAALEARAAALTGGRSAPAPENVSGVAAGSKPAQTASASTSSKPAATSAKPAGPSAKPAGPSAKPAGLEPFSVDENPPIRRARTRPGENERRAREKAAAEAAAADAKEKAEKEREEEEDSEFVPESAPPADTKKSNKKGKSAAPSGSTPAPTPKKKHNAWAFPKDVTSGILDLRRTTADIKALIDTKQRLSDVDFWAYLPIHGIDPATVPLEMAVSTHLCCFI